MNLADRIVALDGILIARAMSWHLLDSDGDVIAVFTSEKQVQKSWRVAGALMEKCENIEIRSWLFDANHKPEPEEDAIWQVLANSETLKIKEAQEKSLVYAINLACVEALEA